MNVFESVKQSVTTRQAAEYYGFKVNNAGMINCPFHNDHTPSMKVDHRFHCFGCGADGDAIDFTAKLYNLNPKEAAQKLALDFSISYDSRIRSSPPKQAVRQKSDAEKYKDTEKHCFRVLSAYFHQLNQWETQYAPQPEDQTWHPMFVEALQKKSYIEYLLDVLLHEDNTSRASLVAQHKNELITLEQRLSELANKENADVRFCRGFHAAE